jgi:hypothetical protein
MSYAPDQLSFYSRTHPDAPVITRQLGAVSTFEGSVVSLEIAAARATAYQWYRDGEPIPGATESRFDTAPVTMADSGAKFYCIASNELGSQTSVVPAFVVYRKPDGG